MEKANLMDCFNSFKDLITESVSMKIMKLSKRMFFMFYVVSKVGYTINYYFLQLIGTSHGLILSRAHDMKGSQFGIQYAYIALTDLPPSGLLDFWLLNSTYTLKLSIGKMRLLVELSEALLNF